MYILYIYVYNMYVCILLLIFRVFIGLILDAVWDKDVRAISDLERGSNILGGNGRLIVDKTTLSIPVVVATPQTLAYYGAKMFRIGTIVEFDLQFPIWSMNIGSNYLKQYILTPKAGGLYLEFHLDKPHLHMPLNSDSKGYYILAKNISTPQESKFILSAFKIPLGYFVYTCKGAIHCDAGG